MIKVPYSDPSFGHMKQLSPPIPLLHWGKILSYIWTQALFYKIKLSKQISHSEYSKLYDKQLVTLDWTWQIVLSILYSYQM